MAEHPSTEKASCAASDPSGTVTLNGNVFDRDFDYDDARGIGTGNDAVDCYALDPFPAETDQIMHQKEALPMRS